MIRLISSFLLLCVAATGASASMWPRPYNPYLRGDIEVLHSFRAVRGPVTSWPIPWDQIVKNLDDETGRPLPAYANRSRERTQSLFEADRKRALFGARAMATNHPKLIRDYGAPARTEADVQTWLRLNGRSTYAQLSVGYQGNWEGEGIGSFDGTYLAQALGNWVLHAGYMSHWWGPDWGNSMILSNNARPFPQIGVMRVDPAAFKTRWLRWIGQWRINGLVGVLDDEGREITNPIYLGVRGTVSPVSGLDFAVTRVWMICGDGRPCNFQTWIKALFPFHDVENTLDSDDPSNQLAGFSLRYAFPIRDHTLAVYGQYYGEDVIDMWIRAAFTGFGLTVTGPLGSRGGFWRFTGEYADTGADGEGVFDVVYDHRVYKTGYRYRGRAIGHSIDNDARHLFLTGVVTDAGDRIYRLRYHHAQTNREGSCAKDSAGNCTNTVSETAEKINIIEAGMVLPTPLGLLEIECWWQDDQPNTLDGYEPQTAFSIGWQHWF